MGRHKSRRGAREPQPPATDGQPASRPARPPEIHLRMVPYDEALRRLDHQVRAHVRQGRGEIVVVHGKGHGSPDGRGVLGPAVRAWCNDHPDLVLDWRPAPPSWGGDGAVILTLNV